MTSFGAKIDNSINNGTGPYLFRIEGQIHHWLGTLCPPANEKPRFLQMYIYDTENEVSNTLQIFSDNTRSQLSANFVSLITNELQECNELVKLFHTAKDLIHSTDVPNFCIRLYASHQQLCYDKPFAGCIGAIVNDNDCFSNSFDIIIRNKDSGPQRINKLHPMYMSLQYPLLFIYGEPGWSPDMGLTTPPDAKERSLSMNMLNQDIFRTKHLQGIHDAILKGDHDRRDIGRRIILPSSFTGVPRYMYKHYQDALAICRVHRNPQYFITFTCNVTWCEILRYMAQYPLLKAQDRPNIIARVLHIKVNSLLNFLKTKKPFVEVAADLYTIEFQKRGLPHYHLLLWVVPSQKIKDAEDIDNYISAEIPDPLLEPKLYKIVSDCMMHGPCGLANVNSPCMKSGTCSKKFPKNYEQTMSFDKNGYARYRIQLTPHSVVKNGVPLDNQFVVPYNRTLSLHYEEHINVEYCGWSMLIKYLFKYISKGTDRIRYAITRSPALPNEHATNNNVPQIDEISNFVDGRFICPHEAAWRIFNFLIHDRNPPVQVLSVHLENMQNVRFKDKDRLPNVARNPNVAKTTLTEWLRIIRWIREVDTCVTSTTF
uniref:uncharacterized protein LOC122590217 n=1 Tax=Erigeron canadensis TaxID=72917 RepID=UPI001CB89051|nr:uncharacterized protein LOC122590217 [Erigeron canadensis]